MRAAYLSHNKGQGYKVSKMLVMSQGRYCYSGE